MEALLSVNCFSSISGKHRDVQTFKLLAEVELTWCVVYEVGGSPGLLLDKASQARDLDYIID